MDRRILINTYGRGMLESLQREFPEYEWSLRCKDHREYVHGRNRVNGCIIMGHDIDVIRTAVIDARESMVPEQAD